MIGMGVGDQYVRDAQTLKCAFQGIDMRRQQRSRIDHRNLVLTDDIDAGAAEGERAGIAGQHAPDRKAEPHRFADRRSEGFVERDRHQASRVRRIRAWRYSASGRVRRIMIFTISGKRCSERSSQCDTKA